MIKVLHICYGVGTGGVEAVIYNYYSNMDHERIHFDVVAQKQEKDHASQMYGNLLKEQGCEVFFVPPKSEKLLKNLLQMARIIRSGQYEVLHIHMGPASLLYVLLGKCLGVPGIIVHVHGAFDPTGWSSSVKTRLQKKLLECVGGYERMACTREAAHQLWGRKTKAHVLRNAFPIDRYREDPAIRQQMRSQLGLKEEFAVVDVARLNETKQPLKMIDIFKALSNEKEDSVLFMVGEGDMMEKTRAYAQRRGLSDQQVRFLGAREDVPQLLQAMDVFVLPTLGEGLGLAYIEAQAAGLPCFAPKGRVPKEAMLTSLFHCVEADASAQKWAQAVLNQAEKSTQIPVQKLLREAGYDISAEAEKLQEYYEQLLLSKRRRRLHRR